MGIYIHNRHFSHGGFYDPAGFLLISHFNADENS